jgi:hypothetical protein
MWAIEPGFDLEAFLARPLVAHLAAAGPTVRPVWFLWEERCFWWLTGGWSRLPGILNRDPRVALVIDTCELATGHVLQVTAAGEATVEPFDRARARRKLARYLGPDQSVWDRERFLVGTFDDDSARLVRLAPQRLRARDLSYQVPARSQRPPAPMA